MGRSKRSSESSLEVLHNLLTEDLTARLQGEPSTADLRAAIEWLKVNGVTGVATQNTPLGKLDKLISDLTFEEVESGL